MSRAGADRRPYQLALTVTGWSVAAMALAVALVGWGLDVAAVRSVFPGAVGMKFQTAVGLGAGAGGLLLLGREAAGRRRTLGLVLAAVPALLGAIVLCEYVLGIRLGTDELLFVDHAGRARGIAYPGRFAPTTAVCFELLSGALLTLDCGRRWRWRWRPSELLAIPMAIVAFMSLIGYAYSIPAFYGPASAAKMAVNTALCFVGLAVALLVARPRGRFLELATTADPGGVMVRRMVPLCLVVPLVLGWLHLRTVAWGVFDDRVGTWWLAAATVAGLVAMMWWCAGTLSRADRARRALEAQLYELANRDALTGLYNRHRFEEELGRFLTRVRRYGATGALLLLDLDHFKPINDSLGHEAGDRMLRAVAKVVGGLVRESDVVGRLGGDEFAVLLLEATQEDAVARAEELLAAVAAIRITTRAGDGWTSASIGVAVADATSVPAPSELLGRADAAMYRAKRAGGDRVAAAARGAALVS
ncbi:MAG TPA: GGDEF domain-containing protein [Solirubrobacteraceae bacterium]|nr:GGDEF domain-containing protein [Solirubrobacteraceae bacterium]